MDDSDKQKSEITLIDYLYILARWRGTIIWTSLISCVLALVISLLLPNTYEARATIMPPENKTSMPVGLSSLLMNTNLPLSGLGIPSLTNTSELFVQVLISRSILDRIITQYDLQKIYNAPNNEATIIRLRQNLSIKSEKANIISVVVEASDPQLAADM
ncbi:MAG: Wzz/FepE/Etk N-terminal domain-containing protein, partial [Candidatus Latescibacteria bacterium]|nr:Wzz/FepE/Etk N-terminal domain-containing protein [Candidatus Latescibacterota bacterium]